MLEIVAADAHHARGGPEEARQHAQGGALAGPVGAEEADDLPPVDAERDIAHRLDGAVRLAEVGRFDHPGRLGLSARAPSERPEPGWAGVNAFCRKLAAARRLW